MAPALYQNGVVGIGSNALYTMRTALIKDLGDDTGAMRLQELGYAAGDEVYRSFLKWLPRYTGVSDPSDLDAGTLAGVLSAFFGELGWGTVMADRLGTRGFTVVSTDWAEARPEDRQEGPSCFFSTGLLASFFTALAGGSALAVMEIECRSQGNATCSFLVGSPETLAGVYDAVTRGEDYRTVLGAAAE